MATALATMATANHLAGAIRTQAGETKVPQAGATNHQAMALALLATASNNQAGAISPPAGALNLQAGAIRTKVGATRTKAGATRTLAGAVRTQAGALSLLATVLASRTPGGAPPVGISHLAMEGDQSSSSIANSSSLGPNKGLATAAIGRDSSHGAPAQAEEGTVASRAGGDS